MSSVSMSCCCLLQLEIYHQASCETGEEVLLLFINEDLLSSPSIK